LTELGGDCLFFVFRIKWPKAKIIEGELAEIIRSQFIIPGCITRVLEDEIPCVVLMVGCNGKRHTTIPIAIRKRRHIPVFVLCLHTNIQQGVAKEVFVFIA
jgi:hypothetical protein